MENYLIGDEPSKSVPLHPSPPTKESILTELAIELLEAKITKKKEERTEAIAALKDWLYQRDLLEVARHPTATLESIREAMGNRLCVKQSHPSRLCACTICQCTSPYQIVYRIVKLGKREGGQMTIADIAKRIVEIRKEIFHSEQLVARRESELFALNEKLAVLQTS